MGLMTSAQAIAFITGTLVSSEVYHHYGPRTVLISGACAVSIGLVVVIFSFRRLVPFHNRGNQEWTKLIHQDSNRKSP